MTHKHPPRRPRHNPQHPTHRHIPAKRANQSRPAIVGQLPSVGPYGDRLSGRSAVSRGRRRVTQRLPPTAAASRISTALLTLRDQVISPILVGIRSPRETLRIDMQTLLHDLGVTTTGAAA